MIYLIELDGNQHFIQVLNWPSPEKTTSDDVHKMKKSLENGYTVIRLLQTDVYKNKIDWKNILTLHIKKYDTPQVIYLSDSDKYNNHKLQMLNS